MRGIIVRTQFEGIHCYPDAKDPVMYLQNSHRHLFYVEAEVETFHDDREIEFLTLKQWMDWDITQNLLGESKNLGSTSCEQIAEWIKNGIQLEFKKPKKLWTHNKDVRKVNVKVFEDNENGAFIKEF